MERVLVLGGELVVFWGEVEEGEGKGRRRRG
jgi:hypothetical protein